VIELAQAAEVLTYVFGFVPFCICMNSMLWHKYPDRRIHGRVV
jgi:hypothetical protein